MQFLSNEITRIIRHNKSSDLGPGNSSYKARRLGVIYVI